MTAVGEPPASPSLPDAPALPPTEPADEEQFRGDLITALKRDGFGRLCRQEKDSDPKVLGGLRLAAVQLFTARAMRIIVWMTPAFAVAHLLDASVPVYVAVAVVTAVIGTWLVASSVTQYSERSNHAVWRALNEPLALLAQLAVYPLTIVLSVGFGGFDALGVIVGLPLLIVVALGALYAFLREAVRILRGRVPRLERGAALVFPIGVVALFVQLFTTEVWSAADRLHGRQLLWLAGLTVLPLLLFLHLRLRSSVPDAFNTVAKRLVDDASDGDREAFHDEVWKVLGKDAQRSAHAQDLLDQAFHGPTVPARARAILPEVKGSFDIPLALALVPMVIGIWFVMALYVYALAWATVDVTVAGGWLGLGEAVETKEYWGVAVPWGPYPVLAGFLGVVATAVFLALALTEDAYKELLTESAIQLPVRHCLIIGIPYRYLQIKHDRRSAALKLPGDDNKYQDDNTLATADEDDHERQPPTSGHSLWYRWTAAESDWFSFRADSDVFEPVVAVYEHGEPTPIDASLNGRPARVRAASNTEYDIVVDGTRNGPGCGEFTLSWLRAPGPANETLGHAEAIAELEGVREGDTSFADVDPAERELAGLEGQGVLWYRWTAPASHTMQFTAESPDLSTRLVVLTYGANAPVRLLSGTSGTAELQFPATAGDHFLIGVETLGGGGPFRLSWAVAPSPPANDDFAGAIVIGDAEGRIEGSTAHASREILEPLHADRNGGRSIWYRWTAPDDGWMHFSTEGSDFDTLLAVYTGSALDQLVVVAANDDAADGLQSLVRFGAHRGVEYQIAVDGYAGASGTVVLSWKPGPPPPPNGAFDDAALIGELEGAVEADTTLAYHEPGEPRHAGRPCGKSVWYRWTAPDDRWMHFSTEGSDFDTVLAVYTGDDLARLEVVAANDDTPGLRTSLVRFHAREGQEYRVAVDGYLGAGGNAVLSWGPGPTPPLNDDFAHARDLAALASPCMVSNVHASAEDDEPRHADRTGGASVWFRWRAHRNGWMRFSTEGSEFDTLLAAYVGDELASLRPIAANDDVSSKDSTSRIGFKADAGVEYKIAVDGFHGAVGEIILSWARLPAWRALPYRWVNRRYRR